LSASVSHSLSAPDFLRSPSHGRIASTDEILAAQEMGRATAASGWSAFEPAVASHARGGRIVDSLVVDAGVPGVPLPHGASVAGRAITHKHSGMDRQQSSMR